jgi:flagellar protein FlgJ
MVYRISEANRDANALAIDVKATADLRVAAQKNSPEALKQTAKQFEALFLNMIMKSMRDATPQDGMFDSSQSKMYTSMLDQQLSQNMANRGVGLADMLVRQLSGQAGKPAPVDAATAAFSAPDATSQTDVATPAAAATAHSHRSGGSRSSHVRAFQDRLEQHAEEASKATGIPAKFMLGQAALESGWGRREITAADGTASHNLFGIKAGPGWKGKTVQSATTEYVNGSPVTKMQTFRAYDSYADAFKDYGKLITENPRYSKVLANSQDAAGFARGLQNAGYATDPLYAAKLTRIIKQSLSA